MGWGGMGWGVRGSSFGWVPEKGYLKDQREGGMGWGAMAGSSSFGWGPEPKLDVGGPVGFQRICWSTHT